MTVTVVSAFYAPTPARVHTHTHTHGQGEDFGSMIDLARVCVLFDFHSCILLRICHTCILLRICHTCILLPGSGLGIDDHVSHTHTHTHMDRERTSDR